MQNVKAWLEDRRNLPIVLVAVIIVLALVALYFLKVTGKIGGGPKPAMQPPAPAYGPSAPTVPGAPAPTTPGAPSMPTGGPATGPTAPGVPPPAGQPSGGPVSPPTVSGQPTTTTTAAVIPPMLPYRKDPFMPLSGPPRRHRVIESFLPAVQRVRLSPLPGVKQVEVSKEVPEVLPPQPPRRVAGILWNDRVAAILETNGQAEIVYPGTVSKVDPSVIVESIEPNCVVLKTLNTRKPFTIRVNLADAPVSTTTQPTTPGYPGAGGGGMTTPVAPVPGVTGPMNP